MPDDAYADPRLARVYDAVNGARVDLDPYLAIADEVDARHVLDIGCGTGVFALLLAATGRQVTAVDPAGASLDVAKAKPGAETVTWLHGDATTLPPLSADLATMTANVAQVFLTDDDWSATLRGTRAALTDGGHLAFETRRPQRRAWEEWGTHSVEVDVPGIGVVVERRELIEVALPCVTFHNIYTFTADGTELRSASTIRFRDRDELADSLSSNGFTTIDVRDTPDRPGREYLFLAKAVS